MTESDSRWLWGYLQDGLPPSPVEEPGDSMLLGERAIWRGWLTPAQLEEGLREQRSGSADKRPPLGQILLRHRWLTVEQLSTLIRSIQGQARIVTDGQFLGPYEIRRTLGIGGMGRVFLAYDSSLKRQVALKIPRKEPSERWDREVQALSRLRHPHIVSILGVGNIDGTSYLAMEYIEGTTLENAWGSWTLEQKVEAIGKITSAIGHAHAQGIIHRDLKPNNIMVTTDGTVKVLDFGLARVQGESALTREGSFIGSPAYMAPEQIRGQAIGPATDIYAIGVMFYQMITGCMPSSGENLEELSLNILYLDPPPPRTLNAHLPRELEAICLKALEKEPPRRYLTASDLEHALSHWSSGKPATALSRISSWRLRWHGVAWAAGIFGLLLLLLSLLISRSR